MKALSVLIFSLFAVLILSAQEVSPIPKIGSQLNEYFSAFPREKVFLNTDKTQYKPGETVWFSAFVTDGNNQLINDENRQLMVRLFNEKGDAITTDIFRISHGTAPGNLLIPDSLRKGLYVLIAYTPSQNSPEEFASVVLQIDPEYSNQWIADMTCRDSISTAGKQNELHINLRDKSGDIQKNTKFKYEFRNGNLVLEKNKLKTNASGEATIPFTIPEKTNGEPFTLSISDLNDGQQQQVFLPADTDPLSIRFYPEGGNLIAGTPSKIGFTAFNKWGIPVDIQGSIVDREGKTIAMVQTFTKGLGLIQVINDGTQKYKLVLSGKTGQKQSFKIPLPLENGLALSVIKTDPEFITANLIFDDKQKHQISVTASNYENLYWAGDLEINSLGRIKIPEENIPQGIHLLSVFSFDGNLLAERMIFVDKNQYLNIEILPENASLETNQEMKIKIRLSDENKQPVAGNISVSISDKMRNKTEKIRIDQYLATSSELETPFSIISDAFEGQLTNSALLDVFLISNRLKGFDWENIKHFQTGTNPANNSPNSAISGVVTDKNGVKVNKAKVSLVNNRNMQLFTTTTDTQGFFSFPGLNAINSADFSLKATDQDGKRVLNAVFSKNFENRLSDYVRAIGLKHQLTNCEQHISETYFRNNSFLFQRPIKVEKVNTNSLDNQRKMLSTATDILDVIKTIKPYKIMNSQIVFFGSENSLTQQGGALLVIDGQQVGTDISAVQNVSPTQVDHINISTNPMDIQRYTGLNSVGIIEIFLKKAPPLESVSKENTQNNYSGGFRVPSSFQAEGGKQKNNTSTTLLWIPDQALNESGEFGFSVSSGKVISDFVIEVQGITPDGKLGSGKATFSVIK